MRRIILDVQDQKIKLNKVEDLVSNTVGEYAAVFQFSEDWDGYIKTAVFKNSSGKVYEVLVENGVDVTIPKEVLECSGFVRLGVYGANGNNQIKPTVYSSAIGIKVGVDTSGEAIEDTTENNMSVIINEIKGQVISEIDVSTCTINGVPLVGDLTSDDLGIQASFPEEGSSGDILVKGAGGVSWETPATRAEQDNTKPITAAAVYTEIGNINALLSVI